MENETPISDQAEPSHSLTDSPSSNTSVQEHWVSIFDPITKDTLLDTTIAQIETLTFMCGFVPSRCYDEGHPWIEEFSETLLDKKLVLYAEGSDRTSEVAIVKANFKCAHADVSFRTGRLDLPTYERELDNIFSSAFDLSSSPRGLCDRAEAFVTFNSSVRAASNVTGTPGSHATCLNHIQWRHLTSALTDLKAAYVLAEAHHVPKIHMRRGDCELLRFQLGESPSNYQPSQTNSRMLLQNAGVYYRGAAGAATAIESQKEALEANVKETVVTLLKGEALEVSQFLEKREAQYILEDMLEEGLINDYVIQRLRREV